MAQLIRFDKVRLVTNRKRDLDEGGEDAGLKLIEWVRSQPDLKELEIAFYCGYARNLMNMGSRANHLTTDQDNEKMVYFMAFQALD